jgi:hypothetical protein
MIDDTPYLIVDNQKLVPVNRRSGISRTSADFSNPADLPFGVVDRVTISREGLEKIRRQRTLFEAEPSPLSPASGKTSAAGISLPAEARRPRG